jgi:hypothetical protein
MTLASDTEFIQAVTEYCQKRERIIPSQWFTGKYMKVYLRNSGRWIEQQRTHAITISNVEVFFPGEGIYHDFLKLMETLTDTILIESVLIPEQHGIYLRRGYQIMSDLYDPIPSFYKKLDGSVK